MPAWCGMRRGAVRTPLHQAISEAQAISDVSGRFRLAQGRWRWFEVLAATVIDDRARDVSAMAAT
jgi:hypothetical protein